MPSSLYMPLGTTVYIFGKDESRRFFCMFADNNYPVHITIGTVRRGEADMCLGTPPTLDISYNYMHIITHVHMHNIVYSCL